MIRRLDQFFLRLTFSLATLLCLVTWLFSVTSFAEHAPPRAENGRLDLTQWDFARHGTVPLNGEWEFYWAEFLEPDDFRRPSPRPRIGTITVPGNWTNSVAEAMSTSIGNHGFATYRLVVDLPKSERSQRGEPLAIYIPYVNTSYRMWLNDHIVAENGQVASSLEHATPQLRAQIVPFYADGGTAEIVMHVANFHFREGGIPLQIELGLSDDIHLIQRRREWIDAFLTGLGLFTVLLYMALYAQQRENRGAAYFSLFVLVLTVRMSFVGNAVAYRLFPGIPWEIGLKVEYTLGYLGAPLFFMYLRSIYPEETSRLVVRASSLISLIAVLVVIFAPGRISSLLIPPYLLVLVVYVLYGIYVAGLAIARKRGDGPIIMVGAIIFLISVFASLLGYAGIARGLEAIHFGVGTLIVTQGWILARRFAEYIRTQKRLVAENAEMLERTRFQLGEVQRYRRLMSEREEGLRSQIAEMLHGRTQGRLLAALRNIELAVENTRHNPDLARQRLYEAQGLLKQVREEDIREVGRRLHPSAVRAGLIPALETLLRPIEDVYQVSFDVDPAIEALDSPEDLKIPYDLRLGIYRILEEALNNIARHADAQSVAVTVSLVPDPGGDRLSLAIADDGKGCDPSQITLGLGLQSINARVGDLGGSWRLTGSPGGGTTLHVELPLTQPGSLKSQATHENPSGLEPDRDSRGPGELHTPDSLTMN